MPVAWHEAVAVARVVALAAQRQAPPIALPGFSQIFIDTTGDLIAEGAEPVGDGAVCHVAQILGRLLPPVGTPEELRALQQSASEANSTIDLNEFINSLTFFARPDDSSELVALAARGLAFAESRARDVALAELTRKARAAVATAPPSTNADTSGRSSSIRRLVAVAIVVALLAGAALAWRLAAAVPPALTTPDGTSVVELAPNLIAYNNQEASFLAGGEFPIPIVQGVTNAVTIQFKEFGIRLNFKPTIAGDTIRLKVRPEVSSLDFANGISLQGFRIPALTTRRVETDVELRDGQTFAVAGLLNNLTQVDDAAIPVLSKIPIIGNFFKSKSDRGEQTELMVLITPRLVRALDPDEVPSLPTDPTRFIPQTGGAAPRP